MMQMQMQLKMILYLIQGAFQVNQKNLIERLRERTQHPSFGPFRFQDLVWTPHVSSGNGRYNIHYYVVIQ